MRTATKNEVLIATSIPRHDSAFLEQSVAEIYDEARSRHRVQTPYAGTKLDGSVYCFTGLNERGE